MICGKYDETASMTCETNLQTLLQKMTPELHDEVFVYCTVRPELASALRLVPVGQFLETEGLTLIVTQHDAEANGLPFSYPCRMITLKVHSSLEAVGFLAAITTKLAHHGISVNTISAYFHDHLFVPADRANEALKVLNFVESA